jgi:phosphatidate cytidylyltransferase
MKTRAITAFFFAAAMLASLLLGAAVFELFYLALSLACLLEFYRLLKSDSLQPHVYPGLLMGLLLYAFSSTTVQLGLGTAYPALLFIPLLWIYLRELYRKSENPFQNIAISLLGPVYVVVPFCFFYALAFRSGDFSYELPLGLLLLIWANDTGAYLFGVKFGKNRLFERHSPKKSWEGFIGGMLFGMISAWILSRYFTQIELIDWLLISATTSVLGTYGDLTESMLKRSLNTKDSGGLLPGHGGLLDRFDSLFFVAPAVYLLLYLKDLI